MKTGIELIAEERKRQITEEGWTAEHDDQHEPFILTTLAVCYTIECGSPIQHPAGKPDEFIWPIGLDRSAWKPSQNPLRNLVKAGALIAAEIDRLQRQIQKEQP